MKSDACRVEVRRSLRQVGVPEHVLDMMERPPGLEPPATPFVPEIVEVQIERLELGA